MARFYSNENISIQVVHELRQLGHDVLTSLDAGKANAAVPDDEVLKFAASEQRILISHNRRDFTALHRHRGEDHSGIVLCTFDENFVALAQRIAEAIWSLPDMRNQLLRVNRPS